MSLAPMRWLTLPQNSSNSAQRNTITSQCEMEIKLGDCVGFPTHITQHCTLPHSRSYNAGNVRLIWPIIRMKTGSRSTD